ncbi:MAG TPA: helix-turn-helix domain-containing protein [Actinotalea sp.]
MSPRRAKVLGELDSSPGALRRHLIAVTQRMLTLHGLAGLTTRQIAREAQVADGVLYNHFAGKDDLVLAALTERATELAAAFRASMPAPGSGTVAENVASIAQAALTLHAGTTPLVTGLLGQPTLLHDFIEATHADDGIQTAFAAVAEYVAAEQRLTRASDEVSPAAVAELLFGACQLRSVLHLMGPAEGRVPPADLGDVVHALVLMLEPRAS